MKVKKEMLLMDYLLLSYNRKNAKNLLKYKQVYVNNQQFSQFDYLLHENSIIHSNEYLTEDIKDKNKYFTMGLAVSIVWIVATVIFVYFMQQTNKFIYQTFMWAVPISLCVIAYYVKNLSKVIKTIIYSILLWVVLTCIYIQFIEYNLYLVFIIGIPAQLALFLWSKIIVIK